jgi:hypothetical protein
LATPGTASGRTPGGGQYVSTTTDHPGALGSFKVKELKQIKRDSMDARWS